MKHCPPVHKVYGYCFQNRFNIMRTDELNLCYNWMCVTSKLVTLCHYIVMTHIIFCDPMQINSLSRPPGYQSAAISESMHQSKSIKSLWNTASVYIYTTQLFGKLCITQLHTSHCKGYVPLTTEFYCFLSNLDNIFCDDVHHHHFLYSLSHIYIYTKKKKYMYNKPKNLVWHEKHLTALMVARPRAIDTMELA
jgi:hypothetical protein